MKDEEEKKTWEKWEQKDGEEMRQEQNKTEEMRQ